MSHSQSNQKTGPDAVFGEVIFSYTRAEAIADGVLVDVSETARETGFTVPVALTRAVWADAVAWKQRYLGVHGRSFSNCSICATPESRMCPTGLTGCISTQDLSLTISSAFGMKSMSGFG